jgi:hypothetical protein
VGTGACAPYSDVERENELARALEVVLHIGVEAEVKEAAQYFAEELMALVTCGPQGTTGYAQGRPRVQPIFRFWPCLIRRDDVAYQVDLVKIGSLDEDE